MTHVPTSELINRPVVGANVILLEQAEAFVQASEDTQIPIILQLSENAALFHGGLRPMVGALLSLAESSSADIGIHLDHATSEELVIEAVGLGVRSVMFDASLDDDEVNIRRTSDLVRKLQPEGVWVEGEIGEIGGKAGSHAPGALTPVVDGIRFAAETGVHGLAVAVGSSHHMSEKLASLDFSRIEQLASEVPVPLVLHGSSGVPLDDIQRAVRCGIRKVNVATEFNAVFVRAIREALDIDSMLVDPRKFLEPAKSALQQAMATYLEAVASP